MKNSLKLSLIIGALAVALIGGTLLYRYGGKDNAALPDASVAPNEEQNITYAPDFTVYDAAGKAVSLSDFRGKPTVVNFWATWCGYCTMEMPTFEKLYKEYGDKVNFLMVDLTDGAQETVTKAGAFIKESGYTFPVYFDSDLSAYQTYGIYSIPMTLFVDANGALYQNHMGAMNEAILRNYIENLL